MKRGTKSVLFGVHQFIWHPVTVYLGWLYLYRKLPSFWESIAIIVHDIGYWECENMDDEKGEQHPRVGAKLIRKLALFCGKDWRTAARYEWLVTFHSRYLAAQYQVSPSALCWADKTSLKFDPAWFYLLRAWLSGELAEYRANAAGHIPADASAWQWFYWIRAKCVGYAKEHTPAEARKWK
jgi:hypothetical protein